MLSTIDSAGCPVHFNETAYQQLNAHLDEKKYSKLFLLVDQNTHEHCLSAFFNAIGTDRTFEIIEIEAGEEHKNIHTCAGVWETLSELGADRKSLLINLGGGVVTDLGGFVASTFMRGISFINIPTSLLSMVDASVGGKTGVDLGPLKNQVGVIRLPEMVLIDTAYLATLPPNQMRSGLAEMLKHGLIYSESHWDSLQDLSKLNLNDLDALIHESIGIKNEVVISDPTEKGLRKILNFGHTLGHAIESYLLQSETREAILHGEAIAIGMILEVYISSKLADFPEAKVDAVKESMLSYFEKVEFNEQDIQEIIELLKFDKKNSHGNINFVLLEDIAKTRIDCKVPNENILKAFEYYST
ncbi:3-dehydroquinate synthase [Leptobacterium flavescens]|uniref:3-dehydroquinate synthase n=1 Tax=Leptobacterium flavescens TaxID=472055 RepID=A0A6P0UMI2_9FLAO|nr:3-dehydroquinate synthase [Leptobacterium flavescens]NER13782.1 3-dehydroquinate synthase [Leptobacterium flavescens]